MSDGEVLLGSEDRNSYAQSLHGSGDAEMWSEEELLAQEDVKNKQEEETPSHDITPLKDIGKIQFKESQGSLKPANAIELIFASPGGKMTKGNLILSRNEEDLEPIYIGLRGYPHFIYPSHEPLKIPGNNHDDEKNYPQELLSK